MRNLILIFVLFTSVLAVQSQSKGKATDPGPMNPLIQIDENGGVINWTEQYIEAEGMMKIETHLPDTLAKHRAVRGATIVARRNLLEMIKGVYIYSNTTVLDQMSMADTIRQSVEGVIKDANIVGKPSFAQGVCMVKVRMNFYTSNGLAAAVIPEKSKPATDPATQTTLAQALKLDTNTTVEKESVTVIGLNVSDNSSGAFKPVLFPKICYKGKVLLDLSQYWDPSKGDFPKYYSLSKDLLKDAGLADNFNVLNLTQSADGCLEVDESMLSSKSKKFVEKLENFIKSDTWKTIHSIGKIVLGLFAI